MIDFAVSSKKNKWLKDQMEALNIKEADLLEKFIRSSGKGGQKVNKSSTCVYIKHLPSGIEVKCMKDRSQSINRFLARRTIVEKLMAKTNPAATGVLQVEIPVDKKPHTTS
ncbi:MAG: peptide chain release factor-like protein [Nitrospirae bacterium YQR-1]